MDDLRHQVIGVDEMVPTLSGRFVRYVNLDNAATAPALRSALAAVEAILPHYGSVHRGAGHKARRCTQAYEAARRTVGDFLGADPERDVVVFTKNTTEAINKLARSMQIEDGDVVLTTVLEHHSNDLPWRARVRTVHVGATPDGRLDLDDLDRQLARHAGRIAMLVVSGASNVTGVTPPIHELARRVHAAGGRILVDAAQLAPHRPIDMRPHDDPEHLDFVALSAHKLYAPFGSGAIVGRRDAFGGTPDHCGGGTVDAVTLDDIAWADLPHREEAGTPNLLGAVAFAAAASTLSRDRLGRHRRPRARCCCATCSPGWRRSPDFVSTDPTTRARRSVSSRSRSTASPTDWSPRSSATSTASACAAAASVPTRTSPTCSVSTATPLASGHSACRDGDKRDAPGHGEGQPRLLQRPRRRRSPARRASTDRRRRLRRDLPADCHGDYHPAAHAATDLLAKIA